MANARATSGPENDPTENVIEEPLGQGIPLDQLYPWIARAKDPAYREALLSLIVKAAFDRGRAAAWRADYGGFRQHLLEATARGKMVRSNSQNSFSSADEAQLTFARKEATFRNDRGIALAVALQANLAPLSEDTAFARDAARVRVVETLIHALRASSSSPR